MDRKTNTVRKEEIIARGGKGRKRGIVFLDFDSFISYNVLSESLAPGGSCASSHSTCFEQGFNFICKCLLSRQGVPVQMKAHPNSLLQFFRFNHVSLVAEGTRDVSKHT